ncbi:hypothetical protein QVD17_16848 [Tagetes erecta]|uniref:Uncharacterized protein n=1 Tax=Tagetes erecta TaxID=13708 RepID=A0AAD8KS45_TARER|nr:hypothetical protein QVD17_16848 [Tagetes erecta]
MRFDKRSNVVAYLNDKDQESVGFRDAISWMKASPIFYAVTKDPVMDQQHIRDFWESATYNLNADPGEIRATVMGEEIVLTVVTIARMLRMACDVGSPVLLSLTDVYEGFLKMGYEGTVFLDLERSRRRSCQRNGGEYPTDDIWIYDREHFISKEGQVAVVSEICTDFYRSSKAKFGETGDILVLTPMNVRIFADCSAPRHDVSGKITYLFRNMYTDER